MSETDRTVNAARLADLPRLPVDADGPVFAEPWQAQAFAMAVELSAKGHFTWKEWAAALSAELKAASDRGEPDDGSHYYDHWLAALEALVTARGLTDPAALHARKEAWADAYRHTPHGQPVELTRSHPYPSEVSYVHQDGYIGSNRFDCALRGAAGAPRPGRRGASPGTAEDHR